MYSLALHTFLFLLLLDSLTSNKCNAKHSLLFFLLKNLHFFLIFTYFSNCFLSLPMSSNFVYLLLLFRHGDIIMSIIESEIIKANRLKKNLTQKEVAEQTGLTEKFISKIESNISNAGEETKIKLMNLLEIEPNVLYSSHIDNKNLQKRISLSVEISKLSNEEIDFFMSILNDYIKMKQNKCN